MTMLNLHQDICGLNQQQDERLIIAPHLHRSSARSAACRNCIHKRDYSDSI
ncbi:hypothetical protein [Paenibacillus sp. FJAT-26967]|uniref:hypothetical protein n=1 Tax=Paenibacillus sp. FJAT-26967 TaxID=1729690 RepID=UPI00155FFDBE|nr:hypothetical protein [Paenibacillus sp. FJAT-26967]